MTCQGNTHKVDSMCIEIFTFLVTIKIPVLKCSSVMARLPWRESWLRCYSNKIIFTLTHRFTGVLFCG